MDIVIVVIVLAVGVLGFKTIQSTLSRRKTTNAHKKQNNSLTEFTEQFTDLPDFTDPDVVAQIENVKTFNSLTYDDIANSVWDHAIKNGLPTDGLPANGAELKERMDNLPPQEPQF